jgi:hypothetical protein
MNLTDRDDVAAKALRVIGRQILSIREQFAVSDGDPVWFGVLPGERDGSYVIAMKSDAGWSATVIVDITVTDATHGEGL